MFWKNRGSDKRRIYILVKLRNDCFMKKNLGAPILVFGLFKLEIYLKHCLLFNKFSSTNVNIGSF